MSIASYVRARKNRALGGIAGFAFLLSLTGCISSDRVLLPLEGETSLATAPMLSACGQSCQYGWLLRSSKPGQLLGGLYDGSGDTRRVSLHKIDDENHIAQIVTYPLKGAAEPTYLLVRLKPGKIRAFDIDLTSVNSAYLEQLSSNGGIVNGASELQRKLGRASWKVVTKEGLYRIFTDISKLPEEELEKFSNALAIKTANPQEVKNDIRERATQTSQSNLGRNPQPVNVPRFPPLTECPKNLPSAITCQVYVSAPKDLAPQITPEILYFSRNGCEHCRIAAPYVAAWQLDTKDVLFQYNVFSDWPRGAEVYKLEQVPAFVVNRKYLISLDTGDKATVEAALSVVWGLARQESK